MPRLEESIFRSCPVQRSGMVLPVKNTFIHFDHPTDLAEFPATTGSEAGLSAASGRCSSPEDSDDFHFWLPSLSSSSGSQRRPSSLGASPSPSDIVCQAGGGQWPAALPRQAARRKEGQKDAAASALQGQPVPSPALTCSGPRPLVQPPKAAGGTQATAGPIAAAATQEVAAATAAVAKLPEEDREPRGLTAGSDWGKGLMDIFHEIWRGSGGSSQPDAGGDSGASGSTPGAAAPGGSGAAALQPARLEELATAAAADGLDTDPAQGDLLARIPRNENGELTSIGSICHEVGGCNPCPHWFKGVCANGLACKHCHFLHDGQRPRRLRPSKQARARLRKRAQDCSADDMPEQKPSSGLPGYEPSQFAQQLALAADQAGLAVASALDLRQVQKHQISL
uniref:C3H1-type domain-containing protein n=1 Tax=Pyrodinium bahamense TaxID=73915 RepID=A0A7S0AEE1_9DINO|mmetsp:Transcript_32316/g.89129  ORF Transcript_32316/g.89129 Transcript_32316/m.89129 type:complete len:396 (+) Transcript_32316:58-1245(+)